MTYHVDLVGQRFGRLVVQGRGEYSSRSRAVRWICLCDCGTIKQVTAAALRKEMQTSCGCYRRENPNKTFTHGKTKSPEYRAWGGLRNRCLNPKSKDFKNYGARGIKVCDRWIDSFENFLADMGEKPSRLHTIDRKDNDGNYEPSNCRWATAQEQCDNRRTGFAIHYEGSETTLSQAIRISGSTVDYDIAHSRLRRGWSVERALQTPILRESPRRGQKGSAA